MEDKYLNNQHFTAEKRKELFDTSDQLQSSEKPKAQHSLSLQR